MSRRSRHSKRSSVPRHQASLRSMRSPSCTPCPPVRSSSASSQAPTPTATARSPRTSAAARSARQSYSIQRIAATSIRSLRVRAVDRGTPSFARCPTTANEPRWPPSDAARAVNPSTSIRPTAVITRKPSPAPNAVRASGSPTTAAQSAHAVAPRSAKPPRACAAEISSRSAASADSISPATRLTT